MKLTSRKSRLSGEVRIPASKSHTIRAVAIASMAVGRSRIRNPLHSSDSQSAVDTYRALGAQIDTSNPDEWLVTGVAGTISAPEGVIDVGNSGTTLRIAMGSAALAAPGQTTTLTGDAQIRSRPVAPLIEALRDLGADCGSLEGNGRAPVQVTGRLKGGKTQIEAKTSQYLTSLLMCAPLAEKDTEIEVTLLNEPGYVQMTLDWLDRQNIRYEKHDALHYRVRGGQSYSGYEATVPADFSSATFFLCAAGLFGDEVTLKGLDFSDSQPDKAVVEYLQKMGADIRIGSEKITIRSAPLHGTEIDMNATPDALPAMAVTAAFAKGKTALINVPQARNKETDRITCMAEELAKMGIHAEQLPDGLIIHGGKPSPAELDGRHDHRIVMALSLAGLDAADKNGYTIVTAEAMNVTFPSFVKLMAELGADMEIGR